MNWRAVSLDQLSAISQASGLYAIYTDGKLAYIGKSFCLRSRIKQHRLAQAAKCGVWRGSAARSIALKVKLVSGELLEAREAALIKRLLPYTNITHGPAERSLGKKAVAVVVASPKDAPEKLVRMIESEAQAIAVSMRACGANLAHIAARLGVSVAQASRLRSGKRAMPERLVQAFCNATGSNLLRQYRDMVAVLECDDVARLAEMLRGAA